MAELTHLNEASVVHNLHMRYQADLIYVRIGCYARYCPTNLNPDVLWSLPSDSKSLLSFANLYERIY